MTKLHTFLTNQTTKTTISTIFVVSGILILLLSLVLNRQWSDNSIKDIILSNKTFRTQGYPFVFKYNSDKWIQQKATEFNKTIFSYKNNEEMYSMIMTEKFTKLDNSSLKAIILRNMIASAPDARIIYEENKIINGKKILCLKIMCTTLNIKLIYYGYYYSGKSSIIQVVTLSSYKLFSDYENEMTKFLNGLAITE